jgi:hypothetical protein
VTVTSEVKVTLKTPAMIWGEPGSDFPLMKTIKTSYDQHQIFVAGRFIGGL